MPLRWRNLTAIETCVRYHVDAQDDLVYVSDERCISTVAGEAPAVLGERIAGQSLWDHIIDDRVSELYRRILARVRQGRNLKFEFHCDGPVNRRRLEMEVTRDGSLVAFATRVVCDEPPESSSPALWHGKPSDQRVRICSWCNRVDAGGDEWVDLEAALGRLRLIDFSDPPQLNHGICRACFDGASNVEDAH